MLVVHEFGHDGLAGDLTGFLQKFQTLGAQRPWKLYGLVRGLNAPPRKMLAPAACTRWAT